VSPPPIRVGYAGIDHHHAGPYLESLDRLPVEVVRACPAEGGDPASPEALDDVPIHGGVDAVLEAGDVDLLWVTLPNATTPAVIESAVAAGVDVFTEKPAARTAADLEPAVERVRASDVRVGVSYPWRGHPAVRELRSLIDDGVLGTVRGFEARFLASRIAHRDADHYLYDAAASRGGVLQWLGVHWLDLLPWLLDDRIAAVTAQVGAPGGDVDADVEGDAALTIETRSGAVGTLRAGYALRAGRYDTRLAAEGDAGRFEWDPVGDRFGFDGETTLTVESDRWPATPRRERTYDYEPGPGYGGAWGTDYLGEFVAAFRDDRPVPVDAGDALRALRVVDAAYAAAEDGRRVTVDAPGPD